MRLSDLIFVAVPASSNAPKKGAPAFRWNYAVGIPTAEDAPEEGICLVERPASDGAMAPVLVLANSKAKAMELVGKMGLFGGRASMFRSGVLLEEDGSLPSSALERLTVRWGDHWRHATPEEISAHGRRKSPELDLELLQDAREASSEAFRKRYGLDPAPVATKQEAVDMAALMATIEALAASVAALQAK